MKTIIEKIEKDALDNHIPIIEKDSINFIIKIIKNFNFESILEIGSAVGYSAIMMASASEKVNITTVEKDEDRYMECLKNIKEVGFDKRINVVYQDALLVNLPEELKFDLIFIDAAKGQYIKFFEKYKHFLKEGGVIITDNINFHGYVGESKNLDKSNLKCIVEKIEEYVEYLKTNKEFETKFYNVGDGLALTTKLDE